MKYELVFTAYNRPDYFYSTIESWNNVRSISTWNTTFHIEPSEVQLTMADISLNLNTTVTTVMNDELLGVLVNPWVALDEAFESGADFVVLAEDDIVVSTDTIEYFQWASSEYQTAYDVLTLNAFSQLGGPKQNQVIRDGSFAPLVWGTWRDRWYDTLRDTWDKDYSTGNPDGSEAGWDWNINRIMQANNYCTVRPVQSRSDHIGELYGTHMTPELFGSSHGVDFLAYRGRQRYVEV